MPVLKNTEDWVKPFRKQVRASTAADWWVLNSRGRMRLQVKDVGSVSLPYEWTLRGSTHALPHIQQIFKHFATGRFTLAEAAQQTNTASSKQKIDFLELIDAYRKFVPNAGEATWRKFYLPVLQSCADEFKGTPPINGETLCLIVLEKWEMGSRIRQTSRQKLYGFLRWAVQRGHLKSLYLPPADAAETRKLKRDGYALSDAQILQLLEALPEGDSHDRWRFVIQLCAVYGLRPEELRYLRIKDGSIGPELWTIYRKSKGGKKGERTDPRRLNALLVKDSDGTSLDWNLQGRLQIGEQLPPLNSDGAGGQALGTYLRRQKASWGEMRKAARRDGEQLTPYSFRHRYAKASHAAGLPIANIAQAMGHTIEVHLSSYARFTPDATADLYAQVNESKPLKRN